MARRSDPEAAARVLAEHLRALPASPFAAADGGPPTVLLADDEGDAVEAALADLGARVHHWRRRAGHGGPAAARPEAPGPEGACIRLPKGREALRWTLHAALAGVRPGAPVFLYGANPEGIRSADRPLAELCDAVRTAVARKHARVLAARRGDGPCIACIGPAEIDPAEAIPGLPRRIVSFPGLFAHGRIDPATRLLAAHLPALAPGARVLDFGCGAGVLSLAVRAARPDAELHALDADALAIEAARRNLPGARLHLAARLGDLPSRLCFDAVVSNPPLHAGVARDTRVAEALVAEAPARLAPGGELRIVMQRTVPAVRWLEAAFGHAEIAAETRSFRVWRATAGAATGRARAARRPRRSGR